MPRAVGHGRARFLDQRRTGRFDGDTGQHGAAAVFHDASDGDLRASRSRNQQHCGGQHRGRSTTPRIGSSPLFAEPGLPYGRSGPLSTEFQAAEEES